MNEIELTPQTIVYALIGLLFLTGLVYFVVASVRNARRVGSPSVDELDCATRTVRGTIIPSSSPDPIGFDAFIYRDDGTTGPGSEAPVAAGDITIVNMLGKKTFELRNVASEDNPPTGPVFVRVIAKYDEDERVGTARFNCGSGSGNLELLARRQGAPAEQRVAATVPHRYSVPAPGFASAALQVFNREWSLVRRGGASGPVAWNNGGDGTTAPFVELSTISLFGGEWELTFRSGDVSVRYSIPGDEWRALAANWVRFVNAAGVTGAALPLQLVVNPA